jgi:hypothetical protein
MPVDIQSALSRRSQNLSTNRVSRHHALWMIVPAKIRKLISQTA